MELQLYQSGPSMVNNLNALISAQKKITFMHATDTWGIQVISVENYKTLVSYCMQRLLTTPALLPLRLQTQPYGFCHLQTLFKAVSQLGFPQMSNKSKTWVDVYMYDDLGWLMGWRQISVLLSVNHLCKHGLVIKHDRGISANQLKCHQSAIDDLYESQFFQARPNDS